jgi:TonB family protein
MVRLVCLYVVLVWSGIAGAQGEVLDAAEFMPVAPGCTRTPGPEPGECTQRYLLAQIAAGLVWPESCKTHPGGTLILSLVVSERGQITSVEVLRSLHPDLDRAAAQAAMALPALQPALDGGSPVRVRTTLPLRLSPSPR